MKRVAVIGFGFMGFVHAQNILKCDKMELAAIIDRNKNAVRQKVDNPDGNFSTGETDVEALKRVPVYESLEQCLKEHELDAVHICVHTNLHYPIAKEALNNGLHVLLEKPFVLDIKEGEELINLATSKSRILMVAHVVRFMSPYKALERIVASKEFGELRFLSLHRFSGVPMWGQWLDKQKDFGSSGGALFDLIIHDIDYASYLLGEPETIDYTILPGKLSKHDYLNASWFYPARDLTVKVEGGNIFHSNYAFRAGYSAVFEKATLSFSTDDGDSIFIDSNDERKVISANEHGDGYFNEIKLFSESIEKDDLPEKYKPESALETIRLCYRHV